MSTYIVAFRNPGNGRAIVLVDEFDDVCEFKTQVEAIVSADNCQAARAWGYQVIEVN